MLNVCFAGVTGWTAPPILTAIQAAVDLTLVAGVSRRAAGQTVRQATGLDVDGQVYAGVAEAVAAEPVDVLVDYTSASAVRPNVEAAITAGVHTVIGSSGLTDDDYRELDQRARAAGVGVFAAGNFSVMAAILKHAATTAAEHLPAWEVLDYASDTKADVPSGTARELAESLSGVHPPQAGVPVERLHGPVEARGADVAGTRVHSLRLPSFVVTTEVVFSGPGERLTLRHDPGETPTPYAEGTLLAIRRVNERPGLRRGLDSLLFAG